MARPEPPRCAAPQARRGLRDDSRIPRKQLLASDLRALMLALAATTLLAGCGKKEEAKSQGRSPAEVTVIKVATRDTPVSFEYVGQTESSHQVQIRARIDGFLIKRMYTEGSVVKAGDLMFAQDPKPFRAQLDAARGALAQQQARLQTARDNLAQVKPLAAQKALSQKDLDDATGSEQAAAAAVETARANVEQARLNLGYTAIATPVTGLSSYARVQEGAYVNPENSLLTTVDQVDPIWVNFSLSENEILDYRSEQESGQLRLPENRNYEVEVVLANGAVFPHKGRITFANASYNQQTGTFLVRATLPNPGAMLRPGQFVRVRVLGATRPDAILVPQQAVLKGAQGHFVWIVDKEGKAQMRPVRVGPWHGDDWFITAGLAPGETVVVNGVMRLASSAPVQIMAAGPTGGAAAQVQARQTGGAGQIGGGGQLGGAGQTSGAGQTGGSGQIRK